MWLVKKLGFFKLKVFFFLLSVPEYVQKCECSGQDDSKNK